MFASGNGTERLRFRNLILCANSSEPEVVVDLFCGIGYFALGALKHAPTSKLKHMYACDMNPAALEFFKKALHLNTIDPSRVTVICCDTCIPPVKDSAYYTNANTDGSQPFNASERNLSGNKDVPGNSITADFTSDCTGHAQDGNATTHGNAIDCKECVSSSAALPPRMAGTADRVNLGLIPSSERAWGNAVWLLNNHRGGHLHVHGVGPLEFSAAGMARLVVAASDATRATSGLRMTAEMPPLNEQLGAARTREVVRTEAILAPDSSGKRLYVGKNLGPKLSFAQYVLHQLAPLVAAKAAVATSMTALERGVELRNDHEEKVRQNSVEADAMNSSHRPWTITIEHVERVKSYAPKIYHFVVDVHIAPLTDKEVQSGAAGFSSPLLPLRSYADAA